MKKMLSILLATIIIFSTISGVTCYAENEPEAEIQTKTAEQTKTMTPDEIIQMSNYMNGGGFARTGKWVLRWSFTDNYLRLKSVNTLAGESSIISSGNEWPRHLVANDMWVTYIPYDGSSIKQVRVTGGDIKELISVSNFEQKGLIHFFIEYNGYYYFTLNNESVTPITGTLYRADKDGSNIVPILEKAVYYPYIIDDQIYFQDDNDRCRLHVCNLDGSDDRVFIDDYCYDYIFDGSMVYYTSFNEKVEWDENNNATNMNDLRRALKIYHIDTGETDVVKEAQPQSIACNGECVYYQDMGDNNRLYSYNIKTGIIEPMYFETYTGELLFVDSKTAYCVNRDARGGVEEGVYRVNMDGTGFTLAN